MGDDDFINLYSIQCIIYCGCLHSPHAEQQRASTGHLSQHELNEEVHLATQKFRKTDTYSTKASKNGRKTKLIRFDMDKQFVKSRIDLHIR